MYIGELERFMVNEAELINKYGAEECAEMAEIIRMHNSALSQFATGISIQAIVSILIKKGIVTEQEMVDELDSSFEAAGGHIQTIKESYNKIIECFEKAASFAKDYELLTAKLNSRQKIQSEDEIN